MRLLAPLIVGSVLLAASPAAAADYMPDPIYNSPMFNFEGFYVGLQAGGAALPGPGYVGSVGGLAGANFTLSEAFLAGLEFQSDAYFNGAGYVGLDVLLMGHLGGYITDQLMAYGAVGGGVVNGVSSYGFGAGLEMPLAEQISVRGEVLGTGAWGAGPSGGKATIGLLWHMN